MTRLLTSKYISVGVTYISWFSDFALYLEYYLLDKCHTWDISSMWPNEWPLTISRSLWPIFHASVILPFIFITFSWRIVIPGLLYLCDKMIYIQIHLGQCDLYYMVEWFRHITWKLFHRNIPIWLNHSRTLWPIFHGSLIFPYKGRQCDAEISYLDYNFHLTRRSKNSWWVCVLLLLYILNFLMIKMLQYKMYPAGELRCPTTALVAL